MPRQKKYDGLAIMVWLLIAVMAIGTGLFIGFAASSLMGLF
jgi:hypothetical protein